MAKYHQQLQPALLDHLRSLELDFKYAYTRNDSNNNPLSLFICIRCIGVSLTDLSLLAPWGTFIVCPVSHNTLALFTALPEDIRKCII